MPYTTTKPKPKSIKYLTKKIDSLGWASVSVALVFGFWGIRLTYRSIDTSVDIKHFEALLDKTDRLFNQQSELLSGNGKLISLSQKQIDSIVSINKTLTGQLSLLSNQYALNIKELNIADSNATNVKLMNEAKFYVSTENLHLLTWQPNNYPSVLAEWNISLKEEFLNKSTAILNGQLDNPFLLTNKPMVQDWLNVRDSVFWYMQDINFLPQQPSDTLHFSGLSYKQVQSKLEKEWKNCFILVAALEQNTSNFMMYYRFKGKVKKWHYIPIKYLNR